MAGTYSAGTAFLQIVPSFLGVQEAAKAEAAKLGGKFETAVEKALPEGIAKGAKNADGEATKAGVEWAGSFASAVEKRLRAAFESLPKAAPDVELSEFDRKIAEMRARIESVHDLHVKGEIDTARFMAEVEIMRRELKSLEAAAPKLDQFMNLQSAGAHLEGLAGIAAQARRAGFEAGASYGGAFADSARARIEATLNQLPQINIDADPTPAQRAIGVLRTELEVIRDQHIRADLDDTEFLARLRYLQAQLETLAATTTDVQVRFNAEKAVGELKKLADIDAPREAEKAADRAGGAFEARFNEKMRAALAHLPTINITADTTDADVALAFVRSQLEGLSKAHIGVDLDDTTAMLKLEELKLRLEELARNSPSVRVRAEAAAAAAELAAVLGLADKLDKSNPTVKVKADDDGSVTRSIEQLAAAAGTTGSRLAILINLGLSIGTAIVPAAAAAAVAIGGIGTAAAAAASGIGVALLGFTGIGGAVQALSKYEADNAKSAASLATSQNRVSGALDAVSSAERSLANTREQVAYASQRAAQTVVDAQRSVTDAEKTAFQARKDLTQAYEDARRAQEDMTLSIRGTALAQRQANLDVAQAKQELDKIMANPRATEAEREQARVTYEQRVLQLDEITLKQKRLQADKAVADQAGVEGSRQVQAAQQKVQQATDNIAKAQDRLSQAVEAQSQQQRQGAFQIASAQQALANAYRQVEQASTRAGVAGGASLANLQWAMDQLGPAGQRFARFLFGLKGDFLSLRDTAQSGMLPGVQRGIEALLPYMASLQRFIGNVAGALGSMFEDATRQLKLPTWQAFFGFIRDTTVPTLQGMYKFSMNAARGIAALFMALTPFNSQMGSGLIRMSEGFAKWAEALSTNAGYQKFLDYVRAEAPHVVGLLKQMGIFVVHFVEAAAPIGAVVVRAFEAFFGFLNSAPIVVLRRIVEGLGAISGALLVAGVAVKAFRAAGALGDIFKVIRDRVSGASDAIGRFTSNVRGGTAEVQAFGFGLQGAHNAAAGLTNQFRFFQGMSGRIGAGARASIADLTVALTTASGQIGFLARAHEVAANTIVAKAAAIKDSVGNALVATQRSIASTLSGAYDTAANTIGAKATAITNSVSGALVATQRAIANTVGSEHARYMTALTVQEGAARSFAAVQQAVGGTVSRAWQSMVNTVGSEQARYMTALTAQEGAARAFGTVQRSVTGTVSRAWQSMVNTVGSEQARYMTALTIQEGAARSFGAVQQSVAGVAGAAMDRYRAAVTTASGEVGLFAKAHELASGPMTRLRDLSVSAMGTVRTALGNAATATSGWIASVGSSASANIGKALGNAAVAADGFIAKVGVGVHNAASGARVAVAGLTGALGGPWGIAITAATVGIGYFAAKAAEGKARVAELTRALDTYANSMRGGLSPATIEQAQAAIQTDKSLRVLIQTTRQLGIDNATLVKGINGEQDARGVVIAALNEQIAAEQLAASQARKGSDAETEASRMHKDRADALIQMRTAFAKTNTENAAAGKLTRELTSELATQKQMLGDVGGAFTNAGTDATGFKAAINGVGESTVAAGTKMSVLEALAVKVARSQLDGATQAGLFRDVLNQIGAATDLHGPKFEALSGVFSTIAGSAMNAKDKTDLLKQAMDNLYGSSISQNEADEALIRAQGDLSDQLSVSSAGFDLQTASTMTQKVEILKNRDALEAALLATRDKYVADVAAAQESDNVSLALQNARTAHDDATTSIVNQIDPTYRNSAAVQDLINRYGNIPKDVSTKYSTDESFTTLYNQLRQVSFMQQQIKEGASPERALALWNAQEQQRKGIFGPYYVPPKAEGGLIEGPYLGPKADNVLIRANPREYMHQVAAVDYYGVGFMEALNRRAIPKSMLPGFAGGGLITDNSRGQGTFAEWLFKVNMSGAYSPTLQQALDIIKYKPGGAPAGPGELGDWIRQALQYAGAPENWGGPLRVLVMRESGGNRFSQNDWDINAINGTPSQGLAQVIRPTFDAYRDPRLPNDPFDAVANLVASLNYIKARYGTIFNVQQADASRPPMGYASGGLIPPAGYAPGGPAQPWAPMLFDSGGMLQPGWNPPIFNATGRPEPVLNPQQWQDVSSLAQGGDAPGVTHNWHFRDTTLDPGKLRAIEDRQAALARVGRAR